MIEKLPPFKVDYEYLTAATDGIGQSDRSLSASTIHMALAAMHAMKYNRYWRAGDGWLTDEQIAQKNDLLDKAIIELLEVVSNGDYTSGVVCNVGGGGGEGNKENDKMIGPFFVQFNGKTYLAQSCCGQDTRLFDLSPVSADVGIDENTGQITIGPPQTLSGAGNVSFAVDSTYQACYAASATAYLLNRCFQYTEFTRSITTGIASVLVGDIGDLLNREAIEGELLDIDASEAIDWILGNSSSELESVFTDAAFQDYMADQWTYTGPVSRHELLAWVLKAPADVNGVYVRNMMRDWVSYSLISGYNGDLSRLAEECRTGNTLSDVTDYINQALGYEDVEYSGETYRVWFKSPNQVLTTPGDTYYPDIDTSGHDLLGMFCEVTIGPEGVGQWQLALNSTDYFPFAQLPAGSTQKTGVYESSVAVNVINQHTGETWTGSPHNVGTGHPTGYKSLVHSFGATHTINRFYVVGKVSP